LKKKLQRSSATVDNRVLCRGKTMKEQERTFRLLGPSGFFPPETVYCAANRKLVTGLPDGLFSNQKSTFGQIFDVLRLKSVNFILWKFGIF
jgi:hypothetical protein